MRRMESKRLCLVLVGVVALLPAGAALAGTHTWDVNEVYSNADGTIQFVELWEANGTPNEIGVGNQTITSNTETVNMSEGTVSPPTSNRYFLIATQSFADLPGAPTPDAIIPAGSAPFFDTAGDTVAYGPYDSWSFGAVPTNGTDSLDRFTGAGVATPTNYAGQTGVIGVVVPALSPAMIVLFGASLLAMSVFFAVVSRRRRGAIG